MPTQREIEYWINGDRFLAINLYVGRMRVSDETARHCFMFVGVAISPLISKKRKKDRIKNLIN